MAERQPSEDVNEGTPHNVWSKDNLGKMSTESCKTVAAVRAVNTVDPTVEFQEPLAAYLAGDEWVTRVKAHQTQMERYNKGIIDPISCRCLQLDEAIIQVCEQGNIHQVVVLGAGMDTRPYRLDLPKVKWFEVDVPDMSNYKKEKIEMVPAGLKNYAVLKTQSHRYVPLDLATSLSRLVPGLDAAGLDRKSPILYVAEGLVYYLTTDENMSLLDALPAPSGSQALITCISPGVVSSLSTPAAKAKNLSVDSILASWKLNSEEYKVNVVGRSQHWRLDGERNISEEAIKRGCVLADIFGVDAAEASEYLLLLSRNLS